MEITILCSSAEHPINESLVRWRSIYSASHSIEIVRRRDELNGGDILFLISCNEIISKKLREKFKRVFVIHASDLPYGRGWSPHIWQIIEGATSIPVALLEAEDQVDSGAIVKKVWIDIPRSALWDEINLILFDAELQLMSFALENFGTATASPQSDQITPTYFPKRTPQDSKIDPNKSISEQFNLIRVCDPSRFPAFFELNGAAYEIIIRKRNRGEV